MELDPKNTQAVLVAQEIRTLILNGVFTPGQPLRQDALCERLNVSRTPLRHALQSLAEDGLVEVAGFKGARVAILDQGMVDDLFQMRMLLEPLALQSALPRLTKVDFAKAEMVLDAAEAEQEPSRLSQLNWDFHRALYGPSNRETLMRTIQQINTASAFAEVIANSIGARRSDSADEHRRLLEACRAGDQASASSLLTDHLRRAHVAVQ
ncbi:GntR family transcriptional regulator [Neorhizobium vignae]|uniref:GntR family transcriptional regulator n=1 Tax=Neorhizobium vignae TaxID=690585 RepID=UPI00068F348C|nr:GntR family transcriptional regulator [Neorhizobium vignae]